MCKTTGSLVWLVSDSLAASAADIQVPGLIRQLVFGVCAAFAQHLSQQGFCSRMLQDIARQPISVLILVVLKTSISLFR